MDGYAEQIGWSPLDPLIVRAVVFPFVLNSNRELTVLALALLWLMPLALDSASRRLRTGLWAGLVGGLGWLLADVLLRAAAHHQIPAQFRAADAVAVVFTSWELAAAVAMQSSLGVLLTLRRAGLASTLFAASTAGLLSCLGLWATHLSDGCVDVLEVSSAECPGSVEVALAGRPQQVLPFTGMLATLAGALIVLGARALLVRK